MTGRRAVASSEPLTRLLARAIRTVTAKLDHVLKSEDLSLDQWLVIDALANERGLAMVDLAGKTMTTGPTLTRAVDKLVSTATVYREVDPQDRRKVRVHLSPRGRARYKRIATKVELVERELLDQTGDGTATLTLLSRLSE